ncbi:MAG: hypothetical protein OEW75_06490, partial [Cyclobacteriaceae bacterium]|nr:hypothetical protein [Cyclobacteriaceae bacterium]
PDQEEEFYYIVFKAETENWKDSTFAELILLNRSDIVVPKQNKTNTTSSGLQKIIFPVKPGWNVLHEGDTLQFKVQASFTNNQNGKAKFYMEEGESSGISFDSTGNFFWVPPFDFVERLQQTVDKHVFIIAEDETGNIISEKIVFTIFHKNQKPLIHTLPPFYVLLGSKNTYTIGNDFVTDPDGDPIVFLTKNSDLPEGMEFNSAGKITWEPSRKQFYDLRKEGIKVPFFVEDQPSKGRSMGFLEIRASNLDMPPQITMIPSHEDVKLKENDRLHLVFHLSDPNGDEDIEDFGLVSEDPRLSSDLLRKNTNNQFEFIWNPGYKFVNDPDEFLEFEIRFFAMDKTRKMTERILKVRVEDTEDLSKKDDENYEIYKETLTETLDLMDQLEENQKRLEKELKSAKKGKKNRSIINAAIGAVTGLSPVIAQDQTQKAISVIGGTSTLTLGSLEASEVIGVSVNKINEKIKVNTELYNQYLSEGIAFARRYNSKSSRRDSNFSYDVEKLRKMINNPKLSVLELDAGWENNNKVNNRRLKTIFSEFDILDKD